MAAMGSGPGDGPSATNGGFTLGERIGALTARMETQHDELKELKERQEEVQNHLRSQDEKLDRIMDLTQTVVAMQRDVKDLRLQVAQYASLEDHRRAHMRRIEDRQDSLLLAFAEVLQVVTQRVIWPLLAVAAATFFNILHAGGVWDRLSEVVIVAAIGLAAISGITSYIAGKRIARRRLERQERQERAQTRAHEQAQEQARERGHHEHGLEAKDLLDAVHTDASTRGHAGEGD